MTAAPLPRAVFSRVDELWHPSELARGPWDPRAQHGGAPSALLAHVAESAMPEPGWQLARLSVELIRPVPLAPLATRCSTQAARSTSRVTIDLLAGETLVARAHALMLRSQALTLPSDLPAAIAPRLLPLPRDCSEPLRIPGLPDGVSFHADALQTFAAQGDAARPGPGAAWFRLALPLVDGIPNSPAMRAAAAADFGNGLSWVLPIDGFLFSNADLSLHLHRPPEGEWIGLNAETLVDAGGAGTTLSRLYDEQGPIGVAVQTLVLRAR
ncbi:thioesterase family protein [Variovorax sp. J22P168]|uniref:thioesterase family protein n=1 Tax=Variovorax jilinensis TaxID=3053513 RepID=UPI00257705E2|nr:thioesterase family protein [Variovorax sp. J22P168]MDM0012738.1 thioesterase family protein [Variovorax sp. J22P168]